MAVQNSLNLNSNGVVTFNNSTGVFTGSAVTQYDVLIGAASNAIGNVAPSATAGVPLISQGASSNPVFGTAVVAGGGTGNTTFTAYSVICAGTTAQGAFQNVSGLGTLGQVLVSQGASALPQWSTFTPIAMTPYLNATGASQLMVVNEGYVVNDAASLITFTPPATCAVGTIFAVAGNSADGWSIDLATNSQTIEFGNMAATTALASTNQYDAVAFVCTVANTQFSVISSVGNLSIS